MVVVADAIPVIEVAVFSLFDLAVVVYSLHYSFIPVWRSFVTLSVYEYR